MMGKVNFVLGRTTDGVDNERLSAFAEDLVRFATDSREKVRVFSQKTNEALAKERLVQGATKTVDKIVDILNQFVIVAGQSHDLATAGCLVANLGLFLVLLNVQVNVASALIFAVFNEGFRSCKNPNKLGSVAVSIGDCLRFQETNLARVERLVLEAAETMYRVGAMANGNDDVHQPFQKLRTAISDAYLESAKGDERVAETFTVIRKVLISPGRRKMIIKVATFIGGLLGFFGSLVLTWFLSWFVAIIAILIGTTGCAILGAIIGFKIVNRRETSLLEDLVKSSNQREFLRKSFASFKYRLQNSDLYVKYAHHEEDGEARRTQMLDLSNGVDIPLDDFTEC